jgi:tetratricopeptide (TPR) repeat protein
MRGVDITYSCEGLTRVSSYDRIRYRQLLREAEGYLELAQFLGDQFLDDSPHKDQAASNHTTVLAGRCLDALGQLSPESRRRAHPLYLEGEAHRATGEFQDAIFPLHASLEAEPSNVAGWVALGWCYKRLGRLDMAIQTLDESLTHDSDHAILHYNLACYWSLAKRPKNAIAYLARALEIDPSMRDLIATETDFDNVRSEPEFRLVTSVIV